MAEWLSTDFLERAGAATRRISDHSNSNFREVKSPLAKRANQIRKSAKNEQDCEARAEEQFGREQFTHEIKLEYKKHCESRKHSLAHFRFFNDRNRDRFNLFHKHFHEPSPTSWRLDARGSPKATGVSA